MIFPFVKRSRAYVVFTLEYLLGLSTYGDYHGFDIYKYKRIRDELIKGKKLKRRFLCDPHPCSREDILLVHTEEYLRRINDPVYVNQLLKIQMNSMWDSSVLEYFKAVTGGTMFATALSLKYGTAAFNLGGGFHHAHRDRGEGFCLINDLAIAIEKFRGKGKFGKALIIDLDYHQGNGNASIYRDDPDVFTLSIHAEQWESLEGVAMKDVLVDSAIGDEAYLDVVRENLEWLEGRFTPEMVYYIAGSDPYEKDELADMTISREAMLRRNMMVYDYVKEKRLPLVVVPGGGYGKDSWHIYADFISRVLSG